MKCRIIRPRPNGAFWGQIQTEDGWMTITDGYVSNEQAKREVITKLRWSRTEIRECDVTEYFKCD